MSKTLAIFLNKVLLAATAVLLAAFAAVPLMHASETEGVITNAPAYAWGENIGWMNFAAAESDVQITDDALSGYVWIANYGWINLAPGGDFGEVTNDAEGNLDGHAWSALLGPINFDGITISDEGVFGGISAGTGSTAGRITFDCDDCEVQTDWRPQSVRDGVEPEPEPSPDGSGGSGGSYSSDSQTDPDPDQVQGNSDHPQTENSSGDEMQIPYSQDNENNTTSVSSDIVEDYGDAETQSTNAEEGTETNSTPPAPFQWRWYMIVMALALCALALIIEKKPFR